MLEEVIVTESKVQKILAGLHTGKSAGPDEISPIILAAASDILAAPVAHIFNMSLESSNVPEDWRQATVTPIYKKGSRAQPCNYRPVSLTCILCKCMEKIVREHMLDHLISCNLISKEQHGFVPGRSCTTQLLEVLDEWTQILDDGGSIDTIYMDFQKAFDMVSHRRLLLKAEAHGIKGKALQWIKALLSNRRQRVIVNGATSTEAEVTSGIPQGSVLGPILFVIFINDLPHNIKSSVKMFADDTKVYTRSDTEGATATLQEDLKKLQEWADRWLMKFHPQKCKVMKLGYHKSEVAYYMYEMNEDGSCREHRLDETETEKDLGVVIDEKLTFKNHVQQSATKANKIVGIIRRSFDHLTQRVLVQLYKGLVRPLLEYGHAVYQPQHKTVCSDLEQVQRRATKLIAGLRDLPYPERLRALKLPTLEHRRLRGDMIEVYKYTHGFYKVDKPRLDPANERSQNLRGHSLKLTKCGYHGDLRGNFFTLTE